MKIISYLKAGEARYGLVSGHEVIEASLELRGQAPSLRELLGFADWKPRLEEAARRAGRCELSAVRLLPVVGDPQVIACVGHNYEDHRKETQRDPTEHPSIFFRYPESLRGSGQALVRPRESVQLDFEGELAVVIGTGGRRIRPEDAWDHVAGITCFNDGSVRDWQHHTRQFGPGKNFAATASLGPHLVTLDELPPDRVLELTTRVNGATVQHAFTDQMIFPVPRVIAYLSTFMTLHPGDVIATGTPGGVGAKRNPPLWLQPGDTVEVELSHVGVLGNGIEQE